MREISRTEDNGVWRSARHPCHSRPPIVARLLRMGCGLVKPAAPHGHGGEEVAVPGRDEDRPRKGHDADENPNVVESKRNIKLKIEGGPALTYAYLSMRGYYPNDPNKPNQDNFCIKERFAGAQNRALFSVFDGHGSVGHECATFARDHLSKNLSAIAASVGDKADLSRALSFYRP